MKKRISTTLKFLKHISGENLMGTLAIIIEYITAFFQLETKEFVNQRQKLGIQLIFFSVALGLVF